MMNKTPESGVQAPENSGRGDRVRARLGVYCPTPSHIATVLVISLLVGIACRWAAGPSLGLFFGPILLATTFIPQLVTRETTATCRLAICLLASACFAGVWALASPMTLWEISRCAAVLLAYVIALAGVNSLLVKARFHPVIASALVTILGLARLTWPVWLSRALSGHAGELAIIWLTPAHPLLAINGVLRERFDFWDRYRIAYQQLTTLNQDMMYALPRNIIATVSFHAGLGALCLWIARSNRAVKLPA